MVDAGENKGTPTQNQSSARRVLDKGTTGQPLPDRSAGPGHSGRKEDVLLCILSQTASPTEVQASGKSLK